MTGKKSQSKPICVVCNRPFDPFSPGATHTMGPTCAKRAGLVHLDPEGPQLSLISDPSISFQAASPVPLKKKNQKQTKPQNTTGANSLPKHLIEQYRLAKIAFEDLMREFHSNETLCYGEEAFSRFEALESAGLETHSLADSILDWLEPEHDDHLLIDRENAKAYYYRVVNGTCTLLTIALSGESDRTIEARRNIATIANFSDALCAFRKAHATHQLSLMDLGRF